MRLDPRPLEGASGLRQKWEWAVRGGHHGCLRGLGLSPGLAQHRLVLCEESQDSTWADAHYTSKGQGELGDTG